MRKAERLRKKDDFRKVYSRGKAFEDELFRLYVLQRSPDLPYRSQTLRGQVCLSGNHSKHLLMETRQAGNRIGFVVGKKVGKATKRNRVRRLLREAYRLNKGGLKEGMDLALVAKKGASELSFLEVEKILIRLFKKAGMFK